MPYLRQLIPLGGRTAYPLVWLEAGRQDKNLLDLYGHDSSLYYHSIKGNADAVIVTRDSYAAMSPREGLCMLFELKKVVKPQAVFQAACQLVVSTILSPDWQPVVVLTDLAEHWQLFWMDGKTVQHARLPSRPAAVAVIKGCVQQAAAQAAGDELPASLALPEVLARRKAADLVGNVLAAASGVGAVHADLLDLHGMLPAEEMQDVYARLLLRQVSMLPVFSTSECRDAVASMYS